MKGRRTRGFRELLEAREARVALREELFREGRLVLQEGINLPGLPKRLPGDEARLETVGALLVAELGWTPRRTVAGVDGGGAYRMLLFPREEDGRLLKEAAARLEGELPYGRLLDLDVLTPRGSVSRSALGLPPRRCLICLREAKVCARLGGHRPETLRRRALDLWRVLPV